MAYEAVKTRAYSAEAENVGAELVPLIVDTFGAWGPSAFGLFGRIARALAGRFDLSVGRATGLVMARVSHAVMGGVAAGRINVSPTTPIVAGLKRAIKEHYGSSFSGRTENIVITDGAGVLLGDVALVPSSKYTFRLLTQ